MWFALWKNDHRKTLNKSANNLLANGDIVWMNRSAIPVQINQCKNPWLFCYVCSSSLHCIIHCVCLQQIYNDAGHQRKNSHLTSNGATLNVSSKWLIFSVFETLNINSHQEYNECVSLWMCRRKELLHANLIHTHTVSNSLGLGRFLLRLVINAIWLLAMSNSRRQKRCHSTALSDDIATIYSKQQMKKRTRFKHGARREQ